MAAGRSMGAVRGARPDRQGALEAPMGRRRLMGLGGALAAAAFVRRPFLSPGLRRAPVAPAPTGWLQQAALEATYRIDVGYLASDQLNTMSLEMAGTLGAVPLFVRAIATGSLQGFRVEGNYGLDAISGQAVSGAAGWGSFSAGGHVGEQKVALKCSAGAGTGRPHTLSGELGGQRLNLTVDLQVILKALEQDRAALQHWVRENEATLLKLTVKQREERLAQEAARLAHVTKPWARGSIGGARLELACDLQAGTVLAALGAVPMVSTTNDLLLRVSQGDRTATSAFSTTFSPSPFRGRLTGSLSGPPFLLVAGLGFQAANLVNGLAGLSPT